LLLTKNSGGYNNKMSGMQSKKIGNTAIGKRYFSFKLWGMRQKKKGNAAINCRTALAFSIAAYKK